MSASQNKILQNLPLPRVKSYAGNATPITKQILPTRFARDTNLVKTPISSEYTSPLNKKVNAAINKATYAQPRTKLFDDELLLFAIILSPYICGVSTPYFLLNFIKISSKTGGMGALNVILSPLTGCVSSNAAACNS